MSGFNDVQVSDLSEKLNRRHVLTREKDGRTLDYVEGWFVIAEANAIFGFDGWDRETLQIERAFEKTTREVTVCGYHARVRVRVRAGNALVVREGSGFASAEGPDPGEVHERALKSAETDATKRALATFGNRFGLALYDPGQAGVTGSSSRKAVQLTLRDGSGAVIARKLDGGAFCKQLRLLIEASPSRESVQALQTRNTKAIARLRQCPNQATQKGVHYADILQRLIEQRLSPSPNIQTDNTGAGPCEGTPLIASDLDRDDEAQNTAMTAIAPVDATMDDVIASSGVSSDGLAPESPAPALAAPLTAGALSRLSGSGPIVPPASAKPSATDRTIASGPSRPSRLSSSQAVEKSALTFATERRIRDKGHLIFVASLPCLICEELHCHAHHITFAQRRGMSVKVSDEFAVPLCPMHHNHLHQSGSEQAWWRGHGIDPLNIAADLWAQTNRQRHGIAAQ